MESKDTLENHKLFSERMDALFDAVIKKHKCQNIVMHLSLSMTVKKPTARKFHIFIRQKSWILRHLRVFIYKQKGYIASQQTKTGIVIHLSTTFCNEKKEKQVQILKDALEAISEHQDIFFPFL